MHSFDVNLHQEKNEATEFVLETKTPKHHLQLAEKVGG